MSSPLEADRAASGFTRPAMVRSVVDFAGAVCADQGHDLALLT
jgi:hypothetical protein